MRRKNKSTRCVLTTKQEAKNTDLQKTQKGLIWEREKTRVAMKRSQLYWSYFNIFKYTNDENIQNWYSHCPVDELWESSGEEEKEMKCVSQRVSLPPHIQAIVFSELKQRGQKMLVWNIKEGECVCVFVC